VRDSLSFLFLHLGHSDMSATATRTRPQAAAHQGTT
jgi:hypothetical protein